MELVCSNPECAKLFHRALQPDDLVNFTRRQKIILRAVGVLGKVERYLKLMGKKKGLHAGDQCRRCGAVLDSRTHRVDISAYEGNGQCGCEWFDIVLRKELEKHPDELNLGLFRCQHIDSARDFALDLAMHWHRKTEGHEKEDGA